MAKTIGLIEKEEPKENKETFVEEPIEEITEEVEEPIEKKTKGKK